MASITIRRLNDAVQADLQEEAREILKAGLAGQRVPRLNLAESIRRHIEPLGGVEIAFPRREAVRRPPKLAK
jgi:plasmid stability protein